jgi:hypothetical protein
MLVDEEELEPIAVATLSPSRVVSRWPSRTRPCSLVRCGRR